MWMTAWKWYSGSAFLLNFVIRNIDVYYEVIFSKWLYGIHVATSSIVIDAVWNWLYHLTPIVQRAGRDTPSWDVKTPRGMIEGSIVRIESSRPSAMKMPRLSKSLHIPNTGDSVKLNEFSPTVNWSKSQTPCPNLLLYPIIYSIAIYNVAVSVKTSCPCQLHCRLLWLGRKGVGSHARCFRTRCNDGSMVR